MVEPKDCQQQETEGKLWCHSHLTLMARVLVTCWILFYLPLLKKWSSDVWVAVPFFFFLISLFIDDIIVQIAFWTVLTTFMYRSMLYSCTLTTKCAPKIKEIPFPFPASWTSSVISSSSSQASSFLWAHSHIWKFATWRFICRGLTVPCSRHFEEVQTLTGTFVTHSCQMLDCGFTTLLGKPKLLSRTEFFLASHMTLKYMGCVCGGGGASGLICFWLTSLTRVLGIQKFC